MPIRGAAWPPLAAGLCGGSAEQLEQLSLLPGDILLIRSNGSVSLVGKTALVRQAEDGFAYAGYLDVFRFVEQQWKPQRLCLK